MAYLAGRLTSISTVKMSASEDSLRRSVKDKEGVWHKLQSPEAILAKLDEGKNAKNVLGPLRVGFKHMTEMYFPRLKSVNGNHDAAGCG